MNETKIHYPPAITHTSAHPYPLYKIPRSRQEKIGTASSRPPDRRKAQTTTQYSMHKNLYTHGYGSNQHHHYPSPPNHTYKLTYPQAMVKLSIKKTKISDRTDHYKYPYPFYFLPFRSSRSSHKNFLLSYIFKVKASIACLCIL